MNQLKNYLLQTDVGNCSYVYCIISQNHHFWATDYVLNVSRFTDQLNSFSAKLKNLRCTASLAQVRQIIAAGHSGDTAFPCSRHRHLLSSLQVMNEYVLFENIILTATYQ